MTNQTDNHLDALSRKHRELDKKIRELQESNSADDLEINNMKQQKFRIKDEILKYKRTLNKEVVN
jgi:hypothetical protein